MPRGNGPIALVHYRGQKKIDGSKGDDFIVYIDDPEEFQKWRAGDTSIPLTNFALTEIYTNHRHGHQTGSDRVSDAVLVNEFPELTLAATTAKGSTGGGSGSGGSGGSGESGSKPDVDAIIKFILSNRDITVKTVCLTVFFSFFFFSFVVVVVADKRILH
jgi:hypothetical protein